MTGAAETEQSGLDEYKGLESNLRAARALQTPSFGRQDFSFREQLCHSFVVCTGRGQLLWLWEMLSA